MPYLGSEGMFDMCVSTNTLSQINGLKDRKKSRQQFMQFNLFLIPHLHVFKEIRGERKSLCKGPSCIEDSYTVFSFCVCHFNPSDLLFLDRTHVSKVFKELNFSTNDEYLCKILPKIWEGNKQDFVCMCLSMWSVVNYIKAKIWATEMIFYYL